MSSLTITLLDRGSAAIDKQSLLRGYSPIYCAVVGTQNIAPIDCALEIASLLLDRGSAIDIQNKNGTTPLSWSAFLGLNDMIRLLLDRGRLLRKTK